MIWFSLLIPFIVIGVCQIWFRHKITYWEVLLPLLPSIIIIPLCSTVGYWSQVTDIQRLGAVTVKVEYYEDWNEYIHQTCTRTVSCGKDCTTTEIYDCSYVDYHPEEYWAIGNDGWKVAITRSRYLYAKNRFKNSRFVDMRRNYYTDDGDLYVSTWDNSNEKFIPLYMTDLYENRVLPNNGVFHFYEPTEEEQKELYQWPKLTNPFYDRAVLGNHIDVVSADKIIQKFNATNGRINKIRVWVLLFKNKDRSIVHKQKSLWKGGNINEFVLCIGYGDNNEVNWCDSFYWSPEGYAGNHELAIEMRDHVENMKSLSLVSTAETLTKKIPEKWKMKPYSEFEYLTVPTPTWAIILNFILTTIASVFVAFITIANDSDHPDHDFKFRGRKYKLRF